MKYLLLLGLAQCVSFLYASEPAIKEVNELWGDYAELGMLDKLLTEVEEESRNGDTAREQELTNTLLTHWEAIMQQRRWCDVNIHWDGDNACGSINYRTRDLPHELQQQLQAYQATRARTGKMSEEEIHLYIELHTQVRAYIDNAPDAGKIDRIIQHIYREGYPQAISRLAQLRQEHPDYCPQAFAELAAALSSPNRLNLLLLCARLPLGVIRETHIMK